MLLLLIWPVHHVVGSAGGEGRSIKLVGELMPKVGDDSAEISPEGSVPKAFIMPKLGSKNLPGDGRIEIVLEAVRGQGVRFEVIESIE